MLVSCFGWDPRDSLNITVFRLKNEGVSTQWISKTWSNPHRFVQSFMVEYEIFVLLPSCDEIVGDSVEDLTIDLGLKGVRDLSAVP